MTSWPHGTQTPTGRRSRSQDREEPADRDTWPRGRPDHPLGELERFRKFTSGLARQTGVAERAGVGELILSHYLPADLDAISEAEWAERAGRGFTGTTTAGRDGLRRSIQRMAPPSP